MHLVDRSCWDVLHVFSFHAKSGFIQEVLFIRDSGLIPNMYIYVA